VDVLGAEMRDGKVFGKVYVACIGIVLAVIGIFGAGQHDPPPPSPDSFYRIEFTTNDASCHDATGDGGDFTTLYYDRDTGDPLVCLPAGHVDPGSVSNTAENTFFTIDEIEQIDNLAYELAISGGLGDEDQEDVNALARSFAEKKKIPDPPPSSVSFVFRLVLLTLGAALLAVALSKLTMHWKSRRRA
jgi:hypothetical protein